MKKKRVIPVVLLREGFLVQSKAFSRYQNLGNPMTAVKRLSEWGSDELIYIDITRNDVYDQRRDDLRHPNHSNIAQILEEVSKVAFMPITIGGRIRTLDDIALRLSCGADKIAMNTQAIAEPHFVKQASTEFGAQCIVVSVDVKLVEGAYRVMKDGGRLATEHEPVAWCKRLQELGAGEILLNAVDRDGMRTGFDLELISSVADAVQIPVIALGGAGEVQHFADVLQHTQADAVAAANIFNYMDQSMYLIKQHLHAAGLNIRYPQLHTVN